MGEIYAWLSYNEMVKKILSDYKQQKMLVAENGMEIYKTSGKNKMEREKNGNLINLQK